MILINIHALMKFRMILNKTYFMRLNVINPYFTLFYDLFAYLE